MSTVDEASPAPASDFIRDMIDADLQSGKHKAIVTRFPPEPNGYLHIGHAKSICLNFGLAAQYGGTCNLRFDDTNPAKEDQEYVDSIAADIRWLGFDFGPTALFASDYFERMYQAARQLIRDGLAYVCSLSDEDIRKYRGSLREPGLNSPFRDRSVDENLELFAKMRAGDFADGSHVLRAKIDMAASNMKLRDPLLYRIRHETHHRTGDEWPIYPMYDFAHPLEDAFEGITHSLCTLEFENNRAVYDWVIESCDLPSRPEQTEFARLFLDYTVMSKRKLLQLVEQGLVQGWDDPRMPTIAGMRRRGYRPEAIRRFCDMIGVAKNNSVVDIGKLEYAVRDDLNQRAPRVLAVLDPVKVTLTNYPEEKQESLPAPFFPPDIGKEGERDLAFSRELYIDREDFQEEPEKGFRRLAPARWIRLRYAYCLRCDEVIRDPDTDEVVELRCHYDASTLSGSGPSDGKVWGVIHWVSASNSLPAEVRLYDRLFATSQPDGDEFLQHLDKNSLTVLSKARVEASLATSSETHFQFERQGYFCVDNVDSSSEHLVFNRVIGLRDSKTKQGSGSIEATATLTTTGTKSSRASTRPKSRSRAEVRAAAREADSLLAARFADYQNHGIDKSDADLLSGSPAWGDRLETLQKTGMGWSVAAKWLVNEHPRVDDEPVAFASPPDEFKAVVTASEGRISAAAARTLWVQLANTAGSAEKLIAEQGLEQVSDDASIEPFVDSVLAANDDKVKAFKAGKHGLMGFFVGQVMRSSGGKANAERVKALLAKKLA